LVKIDGSGPYAPSLVRFNDRGQTVAKPSVRSTAFDDVHLSLVDDSRGTSDAIKLRVTVQPLVIWLWIGGGIMALGTLLAAFPGRRRDPTAPVSASVQTAGPRREASTPERPAEPVGVA
jgi:cytochrome c-type biogenesis protein CcmF